MGELVGVLLAGGRSKRMGTDKALLVYAGERQIERAVRLLGRFCARVLVSVRADQASDPAFAARELVVDDPADSGPGAGLLAAWQAAPEAALLVIATDLPLVDEQLLETLVAARNPRTLATAFAHADGTLEPLCTIWEPAALPRLRAHAQIEPVSLRKVLEEAKISGLAPPDSASLRSVNTPDDYARLRSRLDL
jgi:molybdopterin-guanine dinucleotide biosynthesis protein A